MVFTVRQTGIIEQVMNSVSGITGEQLAKYFHVSSRTIRSDILQINLGLNGGISIKASKRKGYYITAEELEEFRKSVRGQENSRTAVDKRTRGYLILGCAMENKSCDLYDVEELIFLSQSAVREEIAKVNRRLQEFTDVQILITDANHIFVTEDEEQLRLALFQLIRQELASHTDLCGKYLQCLFGNDYSEETHELLLDMVKAYFEGHEIQVTDASLYLVVDTIYITLMRKKNGHEIKEDIAKDYEAEILAGLLSHLGMQGVELSEQDERLLQMFLYSIRFVQGARNEKTGGLATVILQEFCQDVMKKYSFDFHQSDELFENMAMHLEYLIRRIETGNRIENPILKDIKSQYPFAYEIAMMLVPVMFKYKNIRIRDEEIAYMALYTEHFLEKINKCLRTVVISDSRQSINAIVYSWLKDYFQNQIEVIAVLPEHNMKNFLKEHTVDLIIALSESKMFYEIPVFHITGVPRQHDYNALNGQIRRIRMNRRFKGIIHKYFHTGTIRIFEERVEFEQVITELSERLFDLGKIEDTDVFAQDVINREVHYPTDIGDAVMIPHPLMTFAKETAVAVAVLRPPLAVQGRDVKVIFLLAIEGKPNDDVGILFEFFKQIALNGNLVSSLYHTNGVEEFLKHLIEVSASLELY